MNLTETAETVLKTRYYLKDKDENIIEDWNKLTNRVGTFVANGDKNLANKFSEMIYNLDFLPNSPCLMNAGIELGQLSACFVIPVHDNMKSIFKAVHDAALINKSGGGVGYSFSNLREADSIVSTTHGVASGPLSFIKVFDVSTDIIKQGGRRRGANMGVLRIDHPDILKFISAKEKDGEYSNFNFSVALSDEFMEKVQNNETFWTVSPHSGKQIQELNAKEVWDLLVQKAHIGGDPGVLFMDRANQYNTTPHLGEFEATNPCLAGDTIVAVADGRNGVTIKELAESNQSFKVHSAKYKNKKWILEYKEAIAFKSGTKKTISIKLSNGFVFKCTSDHLLALPNGEYKEAKDCLNQELVSLFCDEKIYVNLIEDDIEQDVYDLQVKDNHNFFITQTDNENFMKSSGVLVHNCGEQFLLSYESCNLGSINLSNFVKDGKIQWDKLNQTIELSTIFLNNVIDVNKFPIPEIEKMTKKTRKIGLGIMGLHDLLIQLEIPYDSEEGREIAKEIMQFIRNISKKTSEAIAEINAPFPAYIDSLDYKPRANSNLTTIAPTGSISMIADCSSGCEPYYSIITEKHVMDGQKLLLLNKHFERIARREDFYSEELIQEIHKSGTCVGNDKVPKKYQEIFKGAMDISPDGHLKMQATLQNNGVDSSISKTVNMPNSASIQDVNDIYMSAWKMGCKGVTIYRDGSKSGQVLNTGNKDTVFNKRPEKVNFTFAPKRPKSLKADIFHTSVKGQPWIVLVGLMNDLPYEIFAGELGDIEIPKSIKNGSITKETKGTYSLTYTYKNEEFKFNKIAHSLMTSEQRALTRMISLSLRHGVHYEFIVSQLKKASKEIGDFAAVVNRILKTYIKQYEFQNVTCDICGGKIRFVEGCEKCESCGASKCE